VRHPSKVSALRRVLNTHNAAEPRTPSQLRARAQLPVLPLRKQAALVPSPSTSSLSCIGALSVCQEWVPRQGQQRAAASVWSRSPGVAVYWHPAGQCPPRAALPNPILFV